MNNKVVLSFLILSVTLVVYLWQVGEEKESPKVAVCPTFHEITGIIETKGFKSVKVGSTAEGLRLLRYGNADFLLAGRKPMPDEPMFRYEKAGGGYSFLAEEENVVFESFAGKYGFYTDLEAEEIQAFFPFITKLEKVSNVYEYLGRGILITSWENTDYGLASVIHLMREDGLRNVHSRTPTLYCSEVCRDDVFEELKEIVATQY